jgi:hypothetical protein
MYVYVCKRGRGVDRVRWRTYKGVIYCIFDQIPNPQNCFTTPNKNLGGEGALPPGPFTGEFLGKADI